MRLPKGPGIATSVEYFGLLPGTPQGNCYTLLITDHFSRRTDVRRDCGRIRRGRYGQHLGQQIDSPLRVPTLNPFGK